MSTADNKDNIPIAYAVPDPNAAPINQYANQQQPSYNNMNPAPQQQQPYYPPPPQYQQQQPQQGNNYMGNMDDSQKGGIAGFLMGCVTCLLCFPLLFVPKYCHDNHIIGGILSKISKFYRPWTWGKEDNASSPAAAYKNDVEMGGNYYKNPEYDDGSGYQPHHPRPHTPPHMRHHGPGRGRHSPGRGRGRGRHSPGRGRHSPGRGGPPPPPDFA